MKMITPDTILAFAVFFYLVGLFLIHRPNIEPLKQRGVIRQEQITYTDINGEEQEGETLLEIVGIGPVLSYRDIYLATIPFIVIACILARVIFNSTDEIRFILFTTSILGLLLIWLTTKHNIVSTILYWCTIITTSIMPKKHERR